MEKYEVVQRTIEFVDYEVPLTMRDAPHSGTETSKAAAADIKRHLPRLEQRVLVYIAGRGTEGATRGEIEVALKMPGNTVRPRVRELLDRRLVRAVGVRRNAAGRACEILVLN